MYLLTYLRTYLLTYLLTYEISHRAVTVSGSDVRWQRTTAEYLNRWSRVETFSTSALLSCDAACCRNRCKYIRLDRLLFDANTPSYLLYHVRLDQNDLGLAMRPCHANTCKTVVRSLQSLGLFSTKWGKEHDYSFHTVEITIYNVTLRCSDRRERSTTTKGTASGGAAQGLSLIHIWRCRRSTLCRSRWSPYH